MTRTSRTHRLSAAEPSGVLEAARLLREGGTVAFPTETVYGLGANALQAEAVARIFAAKQRPAWDPLIVHVCDRAMLGGVAGLDGPGGAAAEALMTAFWPGPLTLLLPRTSAIPDAVTAGRALVGVRMPAHPAALALIRAAGVPVAAPSANRFGHTSPTTAAHVLEDLDGRIDAVLDGGPASVGVESTVVELRPFRVVIHRPGAVTAGMLRQALDPRYDVSPAEAWETAGPGRGFASPGTSLRHYAPRARLLLVEEIADAAGPIELALVDAIDRAALAGADVGVMAPDQWQSGSAAAVFRWGPWDDGEVLAERLFLGLRALDAAGVATIVCPVPEIDAIGDALRDRLRRAARGR